MRDWRDWGRNEERDKEGGGGGCGDETEGEWGGVETQREEEGEEWREGGEKGMERRYKSFF